MLPVNKQQSEEREKEDSFSMLLFITLATDWMGDVVAAVPVFPDNGAPRNFAASNGE